MAVRSFNEVLYQVETLIREGQIRRAGNLIRRVPASQLNRKQNLRYANLARRCGLIQNAIKALNPIVRPTQRLLAEASAEEVAEYGVALQKLGSFDEARNLLRRVDSVKLPQALLYQAFCCFGKWDYGSALPLLDSFLQMVPKEDYLFRVGQVNLAAALIFLGEIEHATGLLQELRYETETRGESLLFGNTLELSSQLSIATNNLIEAEQYLNQASDLIENDVLVDRLFIDKWRAILRAARREESFDFSEVEQTARERHHWETIRDLDFYRLRFQEKMDTRRLGFLFYGTPYPSYRERILKVISSELVPQSFCRGPIGAERQVDLYHSDLDGLEPGSQPHALFCSLLRDFYRPMKVGELFSALYPGEYFDPDSSTERVYKAIHRLRIALSKNGLGVEVTGGQSYTLSFHRSRISVVVPLQPFATDPDQLLFDTAMHRLASHEAITSREIQDVLNLSKSAGNKLIAKWRTRDWLEPTSRGPKSRYRVVEKVTWGAETNGIRNAG